MAGLLARRHSADAFLESCTSSPRARCRRRRFASVAAGSVRSHQRSLPGLGASLAFSVAAYGPEQSADQDDVMVDDHPQRMRRHRFRSAASIDSGGDLMLSKAMKRAEKRPDWVDLVPAER